MPNVIQVKRGAAAGLPALAAGEPGFTTDTFRAYIGSAGGNKLIGEPDFLKLSGGTLTGALTLSADPSTNLHAATKQYVDSLIQGVDAKASVRVATTVNITLSGTQTVDGIALAAADRVLVKNQTAPAENGIYLVSATAWTRATDADSWAELPALFTWAGQGTANGDSGWLCTVDAGGTLGTTAVTFVQFSGAGSVDAGAGLTKTGNTLDVVGTANRILVNADSVDIASNYAGQTSITTLGTIGTGVWDATAISAVKGGTGKTIYAVGDILYADSTTTLSALAKGTAFQSLNMNSGATAPSYMSSLQSLMTAVGDIVQASAANTPARLAAVATGNALISGGAGVVSAWGKIGLTTHISGTLGAANGGTGVANAAGSTITLGGALALSGAFGTTLTVTAATSVTLPTSGTLATTAQLHTQNTDTGTTAVSFQLNSGATGARLKDQGTGFLIRNAADTANANLDCSHITANGTATHLFYGDIAVSAGKKLSLQNGSQTFSFGLNFTGTANRNMIAPDDVGTALLSNASTVDGGTW